MNLLEARGLTKKYGDFTAVSGVDFELFPGEIFGFLGPNGAGKTTTINMLTGLARITSGTVCLSGQDYTDNPKKAQGQMGIVPDESNLYDELDGFENLTFCASLYGMREDASRVRAAELLEQFDLASAGKRPFRAYSKGMKRKLTIAAGIIHEPRILFLDEPTTGIDVASARQIRQLVLDLNRKGTTVFLTTHYIEEAERLCHRIAFIVSGRIVRTGTVEELMGEVQKGTVVQFKLDGDVKGLLGSFDERFPGYPGEIAGGNSIRVRSDSLISLAPFIEFFEQEGFLVYEAKMLHPSLEDVFVKVTGVEAGKMGNQGEKGNMGKAGRKS